MSSPNSEACIEESNLTAPHTEADGWHSHDGLSDPAIHGQTPIEVRFRDGDTACGVVHDWDQNWQWAQSERGLVAGGAIVAWRLRSSVKSHEADSRTRGLLEVAVGTGRGTTVALADANAVGDEETRRFNETMREKTPRQILAAVRRLMPRNKQPNWALAMEVFCVGSTYGYRICREAGIDPDAKTLSAFDVSGR